MAKMEDRVEFVRLSWDLLRVKFGVKVEADFEGCGQQKQDGQDPVANLKDGVRRWKKGQVSGLDLWPGSGVLSLGEATRRL